MRLVCRDQEEVLVVQEELVELVELVLQVELVELEAQDQ
jgi:hypothetical protein